jgi:DTW domain-containing protein YfiP
MPDDAPVKLRPPLPVVVLQHPQESREPLSTVPLIAEVLDDVTVRVGLSWPNLKAAVQRDDAVPSKWLVLYLGSGLADGVRVAPGSLVPVDRKGSPLPDAAAILKGLQGLLVLDGSWSQAKTLWWRNAWLTKLRRAVLAPERPALYGRIRREPRRECLSTLEGVAMTLTRLGAAPDVEAALITRLEAALPPRRAKPAPAPTEPAT